MNKDSMHATFPRLIDQAGLKGRGQRPRPRIHDLRTCLRGPAVARLASPRCRCRYPNTPVDQRFRAPRPDIDLLVPARKPGTTRPRGPTSRNRRGTTAMSLLAPTLQAFFTDRLLAQRQASPATVTAYRDTFRLLLGFVCDRKHTNSGRTRLRRPRRPDGRCVPHPPGNRARKQRTNPQRSPGRDPLTVPIRRIPTSRARRADRTGAGDPAETFRPRHRRVPRPKTEVEAILAVPDRDTWIGRRDHALLTLAVQTGLRVAELTGLHRQDLVLTTGPHVRCHGKGRKQRSTPLTDEYRRDTAGMAMKANDAQPNSPLFPTPHRRTLEHRLRRMAPPQIRHGSRSAIPAAGRTNSHPARASPHRGDVLTRSGRGHLDNRSLDGPRIHRLHPNLLARRPRPQTTRLDRTTPPGTHPGTLQTTRPAARLPRKSLNYAEQVTRQQPRRPGTNIRPRRPTRDNHELDIIAVIPNLE